MYGAIAGAGAAVGLLLGGALTSYLSWRWCLYINLVFAGIAITGGALWLHKQQKTTGGKLDIPGVLLVSSGVFCIVYGFSNAATHGWSTPSTYGFLAAGVVLLVAFAVWQTRASHPLLPPRVVLDRNRGAAYLAIFIVGAGLFGIFLFLTYYMQVEPGLFAGDQRRGLPADGGVHRRRGQRVQHRAAAADRPEADRRRGLPAADGRADLADQDRGARGLRGRHPRPAHDHRHRHGLLVLDRDQHRHVRGRPAATPGWRRRR